MPAWNLWFFRPHGPAVTADELVDRFLRTELMAMATAAGVTVSTKWTKPRIAAAIVEAGADPSGYGPAGDTLHERLSDGIVLRADELVILDVACRLADTVATLETAMTDEPMTIEGSKGQTVLHPLVAELRQQRALLAATVARLDIPEGEAGGVPGEWDNLTASQRARRAAHHRWSA